MVQEGNDLLKRVNTLSEGILKISLTSYVFYLSLLIGFLLLFNVMLACSFTFYCRGLPTLSFLGTFPMHDRLFVITLTTAAVGLVVYHIGIYIRIESSTHSRGYILTSLISCMCLILISVIDEVNGIFIFPIERLHLVLTISFLTSSLASSRLSLEAFNSMQLTENQIIWKERCWKLMYAVVIMSGITAFQWVFAYTIYFNFLVNETAEAICEWAVVTLGLMAPYFWSRTSKEYTISLSISD